MNLYILLIFLLILLCSGTSDDLQSEQLINAVLQSNITLSVSLLNNMNQRSDKMKLLDKANSAGLSALHIAASKGLYDVVRLLIISGANMNLQTIVERRTALHLSSWNGMKTVVEMLIKFGVQVNILDYMNNTALDLARRKRYVDIINILQIETVETCSLTTSAIDMINAAREGEFSLLKCLLTRSDIDKNVKDDKGNTVLMNAILNSHIEVVKLLLSFNVFLDSRNNDGFNALDLTILNKEPVLTSNQNQNLDNIARMLVSKGINLETRDLNGKTSLMYACEKSLDSIAYDIIFHDGYDDMCIDCKDNGEGFTALHFAVSTGYLPIVNYLIKRGAQINLKSHFSNTPAHLAAVAGFDQVLKLLISNGADLNAKNSEGKTVRQLARFTL